MKLNNILSVTGIIALAIWPSPVATASATAAPDIIDDIVDVSDIDSIAYEYVEIIDLQDESREMILNKILAQYPEWNRYEINGKLRAGGLPVSPSLKIFMNRDEELTISVSAPFMGEVVRIELDKSKILLVNKMKKVYCEESVENLARIYPGLCGDVQSLLLGRIVLPGYGELSAQNQEQALIGCDDEGRIMVIPELQDLPVNLTLAYYTDDFGVLEALELQDESEKEFFSMAYEINKKGDIDIVAYVPMKGKVTEVELDLNAPKEGGSRPAPVDTSKYNRIGIAEFIKSF